MKKTLTILFLLASLIGSSQTLQWFNSYPTAIDIPSIHLNDAYAAYDSYCVLEGNATVTNGVSVTERGIFWGHSSSVTYATRINKIVASSAGDGTFTVSQNIIDRNSTYYVKAYAIYPSGVAESANYEIVDTDLDISSSHSSITATTATVNLNLNNPNNYFFTDRYVVVTGPSYAATITAGAGTTSVALSVTGLVASTTYTYSCRTISSFCGTMTATSGTFTTISSCVPPTVTTASITAILATSATGGGNVTATGGCAVTARGVCWSTSTNPTISNSHTTDGSGTGSFTSSITSLSANTTYYVRAYATNSAGTAYGSQVSFTTLSLSLPTVAMTSIVDIRPTYAGAYGNVTSDGGSTITSRGFVWSSSDTSPQLGETGVISGIVSGTTGSYSAQISNLTCGTTYYINAYATNSNGTSYGTVISFTTTSQNLPSFNMYFSATSSCGSIDLTSSNTYASAVLLKSYLQCSPTSTNANAPRVLIIQTGQTVYSFASPCVVTLQNTYRVASVSGVYKIVHINSSGVIDLVE